MTALTPDETKYVALDAAAMTTYQKVKEMAENAYNIEIGRHFKATVSALFGTGADFTKALRDHRDYKYTVYWDLYKRLVNQAWAVYVHHDRQLRAELGWDYLE